MYDDLIRVKSEISEEGGQKEAGDEEGKDDKDDDDDDDEPMVRVSSAVHSNVLSACTVSVEWLVSFANKHAAWNMCTADVVEEVVRPATLKEQCRYLDLDLCREQRGPADVFISHSWANTFGLLVTAAKHHAKPGRRLWIDIFAINQHRPAADLGAMKHVIGSCEEGIAMVIDTLVIRHDGYLSPKNPVTRIWCLFEV